MPFNESTGHWLRPGVIVEDRTDGETCTIVAVQGDTVHVRAQSLSAPNLRLYSKASSVMFLVPVPAPLPPWVAIGVRVRTPTGGSFVIRDVDPYSRRIFMSSVGTTEIRAFSTEHFGELWQLDPYQEATENTRPMKPIWLIGGIFICNNDTKMPFWVFSVWESEGHCCLQPVKWCTESESGRRKPKIGRGIKKVSFDDLRHYEPLDDQGYRLAEHVCPNCGTTAGEVTEQTELRRSYRCSNGHEWFFVSLDGEVKVVQRTRFDFEIDV